MSRKTEAQRDDICMRVTDRIVEDLAKASVCGCSPGMRPTRKAASPGLSVIMARRIQA
jgi:antirestriction protein ArdC